MGKHRDTSIDLCQYAIVAPAGSTLLERLERLKGGAYLFNRQTRNSILFWLGNQIYGTIALHTNTYSKLFGEIIAT